MARRPVILYDRLGRPVSRAQNSRRPRPLVADELNSLGWGQRLPQADRNPGQREPIPHWGSRELTAGELAALRDAGIDLWHKSTLCGILCNELSKYVGNKFSRVHQGDKEWGSLAVDYLRRRDSSFLLRGGGYNFFDLRREILKSVFTGGDLGFVLTEDAFGNPAVQPIDGALIGSLSASRFSEQRGVIRNKFGRVTHYIVNSDKIPSTSFFLLGAPGYESGGRYISPLGLGRFQWLDIHRFHDYELVAMSLLASKVIKKKTATGDAEDDTIGNPITERNADGTKPEVTLETGPGGYEYLRGQEEYEAFDWGSRPTPQSQEFFDRMAGWAFARMGLDIDFSLTQRKSGGASIRLSSDRTRTTIEELFDCLIERFAKKTDPYRLAKAVKNGDLPEPPNARDLFSISYTGGIQVTADRFHTARTQQLELNAGITTREQVIASRKQSVEEIDAQRMRESISEIEMSDKIWKEADRLAGGDSDRRAWYLEKLKQK